MSISTKDQKEIEDNLNASLKIAKSDEELIIPDEIIKYLEIIFQNIDKAKSGYLNLITCLICASVDQKTDPRYHRPPGEGMPIPEKYPDGWFSGRSVSEKFISPWMSEQGFRTAKSGWQTRVFERPRPYTLDYPENIKAIKQPFLQILDFASKNKQYLLHLVAYFFREEIKYRNIHTVYMRDISRNKLGNEVLIIDIIAALEKHFALPNSAYLPVIAIYSIYQLLVDEVKIYSDVRLKELENHQAADIRTGAVGDIELQDSEGHIVEGIEIKHNIKIDRTILITAQEKIMRSNLKRYYILTTHAKCSINDDFILNTIRQVYINHGCQIIVNGVIPTIRYYLRMCTNPYIFINKYSDNLVHYQRSINSTHLASWLEIVKNL